MDALQHKITQNVKRFDLCSLVRLLHEMGYQSQDIYYESHVDSSSRSSLCEKIVFSEKIPKVLIKLNLGLLSGNSPLPDFFRKKMDSDAIDPILFTKYIQFFDHHLIKNLLQMSMPDLNNVFFPSWKTTENHYLKLLDLNSTSTLWHLLRITFPELMIKVLKAPMKFRQNSSSIMLGSTRLGVESFLGKKIIQTNPSFQCLLISEEMNTDQQIPWPLEIKARLKNKIMAVLQRTHIHIRIVFILKNHTERVILNKTTKLGYCLMGNNSKPLKILLFSGFAKDESLY